MVDPADTNRIYVYYHNTGIQHLYTTTDGGKTWKVQHHDRIFTEIAGDPAHPGRLWLGSQDGLYRSDDGGATVTKVADGPGAGITLDGPRLIVGGDDIRISTDDGRTFRTADIGGLPTYVSDVLRVGDVLYLALPGEPLPDVHPVNRDVRVDFDRPSFLA
ncbi:WD40/YVTN/BNR-like repeat-containing protein [Streptomyces sp. NPDC005122]